MKTFVAALFLVLCSTFAQATEPPNPADFTVKVHISASRLKSECANGVCSNVLYADTTLDGKKLQLSGFAPMVKKTLMIVAPGDYPAKLINDVHNSNGTLFNRKYELLLPDNIVWQCYTTGVSE